MNCEEFERQLEQLEDFSGAPPAWEQHRRECSGCWELVNDLNEIRSKASVVLRDSSDVEPPQGLWNRIEEQLVADDLIGEAPALLDPAAVALRLRLRELLGAEPPQRVWVGLERRLEEAGIINEPQQQRFWGWSRSAPALGWFARLGMGMAYSAVFAVALGVVYVYSILGPRVATPPLPNPPNPPFAQLFERVSPEKRAVYVSNLNQVDASIEQLRSFLEAHPNDPFVRQELFTTYQQKSRLWEGLVRWQDFSEEVIPEAIPVSSQP